MRSSVFVNLAMNLSMELGEMSWNAVVWTEILFFKTGGEGVIIIIIIIIIIHFIQLNHFKLQYANNLVIGYKSLGTVMYA